MPFPSHRGLGLVVHPLALAAQCLLSAPAAAQSSDAESTLPALRAKARAEGPSEGNGQYGVRSADTATGLALPPRETPQSLSVVTRTQIDDFLLTDVNDLLGSVTGVNVERVEPDRSYYSIRGFEVTTLQVDGIGLPLATGDQIGNLDSALYDRVEVLRGANGLMASTGNPSGTVNFVRKRPTRDFQAAAAWTLGSWNRSRLDVDLAGALNAEGSVRGRVTAAAQQGDSYLDRYSLDKQVLSLMLEADLGVDTLLTVGHAQQRNQPQGVMWGALPLYDSAGRATNYPTSANAAPGWTYWNSDDRQTFAELRHGLGGGWQTRATLMHRELSSDGELFNVTGVPDADTRAGLVSYPSKYDHRERQWIADWNVDGGFQAGGRRHTLRLGLNVARSHSVQHSSVDAGTAFTESEMLSGSLPRPAFGRGLTGFGDFTTRRTTLYAVTHLRPSDDVGVLLGGNLTRATSDGISYGASKDYARTATSPYLGLTWAIGPQVSLYGSWAGIFNPQSQLDVNGNTLPAIEGRTLEAGAKGEWMGGRLNASAAVFRVQQDHTAESVGWVVRADDSGFTAYKGVDATSTGFELDVGGLLAPGWQVTGGYTQLRIEGPDGQDVRTYVPRKTLRLNTQYALPMLPALKLGLGLKWQSAYQRTDTVGTQAVVTRQGAYALLDLMASYQINAHWNLTAKVENAGDRRTLTSLMWPGQSYAGAPRNVNVSLRWTY